MPLGIYLVGDFQDIFRADIDTQAATLATFRINDMFVCHIKYSFIYVKTVSREIEVFCQG